MKNIKKIILDIPSLDNPAFLENSIHFIFDKQKILYTNEYVHLYIEANFTKKQIFELIEKIKERVKKCEDFELNFKNIYFRYIEFDDILIIRLKNSNSDKMYLYITNFSKVEIKYF